MTQIEKKSDSLKKKRDTLQLDVCQHRWSNSAI
jgi:hypothetical protein